MELANLKKATRGLAKRASRGRFLMCTAAEQIAVACRINFNNFSKVAECSGSANCSFDQPNQFFFQRA